jgi:hypothetical protein
MVRAVVLVKAKGTLTAGVLDLDGKTSLSIEVFNSLRSNIWDAICWEYIG